MTDNQVDSIELLTKFSKPSHTAEELHQLCAEYEEKKEFIPEELKDVAINTVDRAVERAKMAEENAKMAEENAKMAEENAKREEENAKRAGVFYARIDELFISESESVNKLKLLKTPEMKSL